MIFDELQAIFRDVFDDPDMIITNELTADDVSDWSSLVHIQLMAAAEEHFKVKFNTSDIRRMKKVGDFISLIESKLS